MTLIVQTARVSCRDPDRFDVTRKSGGVDGTPFAPSWALLTPALAARSEARKLRAAAATAVDSVRSRLNADAELLEGTAWAAYVPDYLAEMRVSYVRFRPAWDSVLARERVVLCCYCADPERCHRRLLARILVRIGATDRGELPSGASGSRRRR